MHASSVHFTPFGVFSHLSRCAEPPLFQVWFQRQPYLPLTSASFSLLDLFGSCLFDWSSSSDLSAVFYRMLLSSATVIPTLSCHMMWLSRRISQGMDGLWSSGALLAWLMIEEQVAMLIMLLYLCVVDVMGTCFERILIQFHSCPWFLSLQSNGWVDVSQQLAVLVKSSLIHYVTLPQ